MPEMAILGRPGVVTTSVRVTRADGTVEPERVVSYKDPRPLRQAVVQALIEAGAVIAPSELAAAASTARLFRRLIAHYGKA